MSSCLTNNTATEAEIEKIPSYLFCKWLSGNSVTLFAANMFNQYYKELPIDVQYKAINKAFKNKIKFIKYPKGNQEKATRDQEIVSWYFKVSLDKAKEYLEFISENELKSISNLYDSISEKS